MSLCIDWSVQTKICILGFMTHYSEPQKQQESQKGKKKGK